MHVAYLMRRLTVVSSFLLITAISLAALAQSEPRPVRKGRKYKVRIDSAPQQAAIYLDDVKYGIVGYTPWDGRLQKGDWKLIIKKDGYQASERTIRVNRNRRTQETFVPLVKKEDPAILDLRADADKNAFGAEVWVDGQLQGNIPVLLKVADGRHLVEIKKADFDVFKQWVEVKEGDRITINPMLKMNAVGSLLVEADVPDAEVWVDGNKHPDNAPTLIAGLSAGPHIVEVRKAPAMPWRQTIQVVANKTVKVSGQLKATMGGSGGTIRVLSNVEGAEVLLDGTKVGVAPIDIKDVSVGEHVIEVRAAAHQPREERLTVSAGSAALLKLDLRPLVDSSKTVIKVVSPVPEADVFIDGERIGTAPQEKEVGPGPHFVVVSKPGYQKYEEKVTVKAGKALTITAALKAVGGLRLLSNPTGAQVMIDGQEIGTTPMVKEDVEVGEHIVTVKLDKYYDFEQPVKIEGGQLQVVNATLEMIDTGMSATQLSMEQRGQTSFSARTLRREKATLDLGVGYPYFVDGGITVGAGTILDKFGFDASLRLRTFFKRTEIGARGRLNLINDRVFALGAFMELGGGAAFFDDSGRNNFYSNLGIIGSLQALGRVTVSARAYWEFWSDRHCPEPVDRAAGTFEQSPPEMCENYLARENDPASMAITQEEVDRINKLLDGDDLFGRENGNRLMTSLIVEFALRQRWNIWVMFEGPPFQKERAALTDAFNRVFSEKDIGTYMRAGATFKF